MQITFGLCTAFLILVIVGVFCCVYLFRFYKVYKGVEPAGEAVSVSEAGPRDWGFTCGGTGRVFHKQLAFVSFLGLFL